jgi:hypothetical protein
MAIEGAGEALDLARLRKVAEAATPGPWRAVEGDLEGGTPLDYVTTLLGNRGQDGTTTGRLFLTLAPNNIDPERGAEVVPAMTGDGPIAEANAEYIATFDPPAVLALLDALADLRDHPMTRHALAAALGLVLVVGLLVAAVVGWVDHAVASVEIGGLQ